MAQFQPEGHGGPKVPTPTGHGGPKVPTGHGGPKISPTNLDFGTQTQGNTTPINLPIDVINDGSRQLDWSASILSGANWFSLSTYSGQVAANSQEAITATAQTGSLGVGTYTAEATFKLVEGGGQLNKLVTATVKVQ
jgi:hypothetical protein